MTSESSRPVHVVPRDGGLSGTKDSLGSEAGQTTKTGHQRRVTGPGGYHLIEV